MDFLKGLNPQQREAVAHVEGPLLLLAGAGSGKTRVITHRIAHMIQDYHVPGPCVLAVTFTNKASAEMRERVQKLLGNTTTQASPLVSTFHSFCVRSLRRDGQALAQIRPGFTKTFNIYDDDDQLALIKSIFRQLGLDEQFMKYRAALSRISHGKNHGETPDDFHKASTDPKMSRLAVVYEQYEARLRQANALDFDDLLLETVRLLRHDTATRQLYNRRFEYVMIDEYQDTNRSQYELMRLLTEARHNICVVGDEDQSIYGWRGADIRNILDFERDYPNAKVIRLEQNYRSTKTILEGASALVANNKERKGKWLWTESTGGEKIGYYQAIDAENEALFIADTINQLLRKEPDQRAAVLYRTNFQSRQIEEALRRYGRKYTVVGGFSFYQRAEVKDILSYLKVLLTPQDSIGMLRIINTPARGIGKTTIEQIEQYALQKVTSVWGALGHMLEERIFPGRADAALSAFKRMIDELSADVTTRPINETLEAILDRTGYRKMLESEHTPEAESRIANIQELLNAATEAHERGEGIADFLDHAALVADSDDLDEKSQISLLTMHNAKGLEFPFVFIAGLEEGLFPHSRSLNSEAQMEEERRLCYVGMTRAEKRLYLTCARYRRKFGGGPPEVSLPSRFLGEVPRGLMENMREDDPVRPQVDLYAERSEVRETVKKNLYTGKTYNSLDNIAQFFGERGMPPPRGIVPKPASAPVAEAARTNVVTPNVVNPLAPRVGVPQPGPGKGPMLVPRPGGLGRPVAPAQRTLGQGSKIQHPRYGRGTVLRREGDGEDAKLTVSFPQFGVKKIVEKFAGIKIEE